MPTDLTDEDWHTIHCVTKAVQEPFTKPEGISAIAEANYRAGLAAGNKERDQMQRVIEAAKAIDYEMFNGMTPSVGSANKLKSALAQLEQEPTK